jgi:WD40 repeat protein
VTEGLDDPFTLHLVARDEGRASDLPALPDAMRAEFQAAVACLDLLDALRPHWKAAPAGAAGQADPPPTDFGRFQLRRVIGRGGFGIVYLAFDPLLSREVALKLPRPDCLMTPELRRRFLREGHAAAGLEHVNIVTVHEAGEINGVCYLASGYCPGPTLAEWLRGHTGPVPFRTAARVVAELADGVEHAHQRGVLHRDLKPANVLLSFVPGPSSLAEDKGQGTRDKGLIPKITDFGLAKLRDVQSEDTRSGLLVGTPQYMAPEQAQGDVRQVGPAADIHALGVILYELLLQRRPFVAATDPEILRKIAQDEPEPPRRIRTDIPRDLQSVCLKCLEKSPARRYATAGELAADLRRFLRGEAVLARSPSLLELGAKWARRRPAVAALCAVSLLGLLGLAGLGAWHYREMEKKNVDLQAALDDAQAQRREVLRTTYAARIRMIGTLWQDGDTSAMADLLNDLKPRDGEDDLREFAWHYLRRLAENEVWLSGPHGGAQTAAFSRDGRTLAVVHDDHDIVVWDLDNRQPRITLREPEFHPAHVDVSPDGQWVAADMPSQGPGRPGVVVWNARTGERRARPELGGWHPRRSFAFAPDGRWLALARLLPPDGRSAIALWDPATYEERVLFTGFDAVTIAFLPDGKTLVAAGWPSCKPTERQLLLVDVATGREVARLSGLLNEGRPLAVSPDGRLLATQAKNRTVQVWDVTERRELTRFQEGSGGHVHSLAFLRGGRGLAVKIAVDRRPDLLRLHDLVTGEVRENPYPWARGSPFVGDAAVRRLAFLGDAVRLWQPYPSPPALALPAHKEEVWAVAFAPDGRTLASASDDANIKLWEADTWKARARLTKHDKLVTCLAYGPNNVLASGSFDETVRLWDGATGRLLACCEGHTDKVYGIAFSPDGSRVASGGSDETVRVWDAKTGQPVKELPTPGHGIRALVFSPDGRSLVAAGGNGLLAAWDTATWDRRRSWQAVGQLMAVAFLTDNETLVTGSDDGPVQFWSLRGDGAAPEGKVRGGHYKGVLAVAVSPDGRTLATGGMDRAVRLWHVPTGQELIGFKNLATRVNALAFSPDGQTLAAALHDGTVLLWRAVAEPDAS